MRILINDFEEARELHTKTFARYGYEENELIFCTSFEQSREFITRHLEGKKGNLDLIVTNQSADSGSDILRAHELCFFKNNLTTSYSQGNFRVSAIPIILYSNKETKTSGFLSGFDSIVQQKEGEHALFISECERIIKDWRKQVLADLEVLGLKWYQLQSFHTSPLYLKHYKRNIAENADFYFTQNTKVVSKEFIMCPASLKYNWLTLTSTSIERTISRYVSTYTSHVQYDRVYNERTILHRFFNENRMVLLRDAFVDLKYELNLDERNSTLSEECDYVLLTDYPDHLSTSFFEVKKEDVQFYAKKKTKRPQPTSEFMSHMFQVRGYRNYSQNPTNAEEMEEKFGYRPGKFDYTLLAGRLEEKMEVMDRFESDLPASVHGIKVLTFEELEEKNVNFYDKFNRLAVEVR